MAYASTNPLQCLTSGLMQASMNIYGYIDGDAIGSVDGVTDYFTGVGPGGADNLGVKVGDFINFYSSGDAEGYQLVVTAVDADGNATAKRTNN